MIKKWLVNYAKAQMAEHTSVVPTATWSDRDRKFYINSIAGLLVYKPKNLNDQTRFRNDWINKFELIKQNANGKFEEQLFEFYRDIRTNEKKVQYKANLRTRLKDAKWKLKV